MSRTQALATSIEWSRMRDDQVYYALRDGPRKGPRWVIDTLRKRLAPEHVSLAERLMALQSTSEGRKPQNYERVDFGNGAETALNARIDAARAIAGFEGAVFARLGRGGVLCLRSIAEGDALAETIRKCGYAAGSDRSVRELVQITMLTAEEYDDACRDSAQSWKACANRSQCA